MTYRESLSPWQERHAKQLLREHAERNIRIAEVARQCGLSRSHFTRAFKATTGETPQRWAQRHRIEQARQLLESDQPIGDIALQCGFSDQSHLTRIFVRRTGFTPGAYRRIRRLPVFSRGADRAAPAGSPSSCQ
ncbi:MAG: AraC family transcriptional regulator [Steroidobacteraceae bacterium]